MNKRHYISSSPGGGFDLFDALGPEGKRDTIIGVDGSLFV
jgi:hypothetical protein